MRKVIILFLDAFSSKYLSENRTPFLFELANKGDYPQLKNMFSFQGIGASIFTGTSTNSHKIWCDWVLRQKKKEISPLLVEFLALCDYIPNDRIIKDIRWVICKLLKFDSGTPNIIPSHLLPYFELKLKRKYTDERSLGNIVTLFDQLTNFDVKYFTLGLSDSISDKKNYRSLIKNIDKDYDLVLLKIGALDAIGHKYGPNSPQILEKIKEIDDLIKDLVRFLTTKNEEYSLVIFSDHGMSEVKNSINLKEKLDNLGLINGKDYLVFLDSTIARFWFFSKESKSKIEGKLNKDNYGKILDQSDLRELGLEHIGSEYGMRLFALNEGYVFFPDYYRIYNKPKGMHGYFNSDDNPILLTYPKTDAINLNQTDKVQLIDIMPIVLKLLNIPVPNTCESDILLEHGIPQNQ